MASESGLDHATLELLAGSLRELFGRGHGVEANSAALANLGWSEVRSADPASATGALFTEQGRAAARSTALDDIVLDALADALPAGTGRRAVCHPYDDRRAGGILTCGRAGLGEVAEVIAPIPRHRNNFALIPADQVRDSIQPAAGFDTAGDWLRLTNLPLDRARVVDSDQAWPRAVAAARIALAVELTAICSVAVSMAAEHTSTREQFGRPIATFQAVRHRVAEAHVELEAARTTIRAAQRADDVASAARIAKIRAGRAQAAVFRHTLHVFGAVALTQESAVSRYAVRAAVLDSLHGDHAALAAEIGAEFIVDVDPGHLIHI